MKQTWYIDFDSTLYNTTKLTTDMLNSLAQQLHQMSNIPEDEALSELKANFNRERIYNIYKLCKFFELKYLLPVGSLEQIVNNILANGSKYLYDDSKDFLNQLHNNGDSVQLLTAAAGRENVSYQLAKVQGSSIADLFDNTIITAVPKYTLDLNYEKGIFVDDNPQDLQGLWKSGAQKVLRIKRPDNKYSRVSLDNSEIMEYTSLSEILYIKEEERNHDG